MTKFKAITLDINQELNPGFGGMHEVISKLAKEREKVIEDKIKSFGITEENAKDYHIDITQGLNKYVIYKKEYIGEFII